MLREHLEKLGHEVVMTRTDPNKDLALVSRGKASAGCDLFLSMHTNAVGSVMNENVSHASIIRMTDDTTVKCDEVAKEFASQIGPVIAHIMGITYRISTRQAQSDRNGDGIKNDNYYGVLHGARLVKTPGLILEHGFHTHSGTVRWLLRNENLDVLAKAEAECIDKFFRQQSQQEPKQQYYFVVAGDNLSSIARKHNTTLQKLIMLNPQITNPNKIYCGQKIRVK